MVPPQPVIHHLRSRGAGRAAHADALAVALAALQQWADLDAVGAADRSPVDGLVREWRAWIELRQSRSSAER